MLDVLWCPIFVNNPLLLIILQKTQVIKIKKVTRRWSCWFLMHFACKGVVKLGAIKYEDDVIPQLVQDS